MAKSKKIKNKKANQRPEKHSFLPNDIHRILWGTAMFLAAIIVGLSFFGLAGRAGELLMRFSALIIGKTVFAAPLILVFIGITLFTTKKNNFLAPVATALVLAFLGINGMLGSLAIFYGKETANMGGWLGYIISWLPMTAFGLWASLAVFLVFIGVGGVIVWRMMPKDAGQPSGEAWRGVVAAPLKKIIVPKFTIKELAAPAKEEVAHKAGLLNMAPVVSDGSKDAFQIKSIEGRSEKAFGAKDAISQFSAYRLPPIDLLESDKGQAQSGDIKVNSAIIKRTLDNFGIPIEISEINIGPAVTQYAIKPAEGIKLSKIVGLSNDLALALAAHPIRIEAPIPGRPLVGIEVPNRVRVQVRLRNLIENPALQTSPAHLMIALGRDVAGNPVYADLARMPHLLVAGSTGTGKTIGLNSIILSLLYQNSPDILRFILVDPKRVEFPVYNDLPHLLTPVIFDPQRTVNALKWLVGEMERRFEVLSEAKARDILSYNSLIAKEQEEPMPYIVLIIDELADLMAARGRDIEAGVVRLAQMARATGIHLVVATQRPSVEVITGLIKANITSRMAFQVASQVDSRTVLDAAGSEKLLGLGDMLFISAEMSKPRRIQGAYVSEKEVRKAVKFIKDEAMGGQKEKEYMEEKVKMAEDLAKILNDENSAGTYFSEDADDPMYEEAKKLVTETRKASASFLQRRLRLGYARAARLIDMLEERGIVGPGEGAKPREVLIGKSGTMEEENEGWDKV